MSRLKIILLAVSTMTFAVSQGAAAQSPQRFPEIPLEKLTPAQKKWVDSVSAPPRGANFTQPPYRIYMRSPELAERITGMSDYLRWNTQFPARLTQLALGLAQPLQGGDQGRAGARGRHRTRRRQTPGRHAGRRGRALRSGDRNFP